MKKVYILHISMLLSLPCVSSAMEKKKALTPAQKKTTKQTNSSIPVPTTPQPYTQSIQTQPESPQYEEKSWTIRRGFQALFCSDTQLALDNLKDLKEKPKSTVDKSNKGNRGINDTIGKAKYIRTAHDITTVDGLQQVARLNEIHTENLGYMINPCHTLDISLNLDALTEAYRHLKVEDQQDILYARLVLSEAQKRLKERKKLRKTIYTMNKERIKNDNELGEISDDEFDDQNIFNHLSSMTTQE